MTVLAIPWLWASWPTDGRAGPRAGDQREGAEAVRAISIAAPIRLDGRMDESFWATADSIEDFREREPNEGAPASEITVVKLARDANALYV